jgi:Zn-dependent M28 family amino/carboxypeptidase
MVFALNIDGGGYSDITIATVIGLGRTTADPLIIEGAEAYNLGVIPDPAPEQGLFDRSDNVNFARQGIPAPTFSPGFRSFSDQAIADYYHRPQDEAGDDFNYSYLKRFVQAYTHVARLIANAD